MKKQKKNISKAYPPLSLCMIVKDEGKWLAQCLSSVVSIVQEIIIVDTGSSDKTVEIAESFGARVFHHTWNNDFGEARNVSLEHATGEWILILDADEIIAQKDLPGILEACLSGEGNAYTLITRNYTADSRGSNWVPSDEAYTEVKGLPGWFPSRKVRLFKNNRNVRFEGVVHELTEPSIKKLGWHIGLCDIPVHHFGRLEPYKQKEKEGTYLKLGHKKIVAGSQDPKACYERGVQNAELGLHAKAIEDFYAARKIAPSFPGIDSYLGASLTHLGRCDEAIVILNEGMKKEPGNAGLWNNLGLAWYVKQDYDKAVEYLNKAICLNPEYVSAHKNLGMALSKKGRAVDAADAFQTALGLNPSLVEIKGALEELEKIINSGEKQDKSVGQSAFCQASKFTSAHRIDIQLALCLSYARQLDIDSCLHHCEIILKQLHLDCGIRLDSLEDLSELFLQIGLDLEKRRLFSEAMLARNTSAYLKSIIPD